MKKIYGLVSALLLSAGSFSQQVVMSESFDASTTPSGWINTAVTGGPWEFGNNTTNSPGYDVSNVPDNTGNNGYYAWVDFSGTDNGVVLESPVIDVSMLTNVQLKFYYVSYYSGSINPLNILYVEAWDGSMWVGVDSLQQNNSSAAWVEINENLTPYTYSGGDSLRIRFRAESGGASNDYNNDLLIDDITVFQPVPYDIAALSITTDTVTCGLSPLNVYFTYQNVGTDSFPAGTVINFSYTDGTNTITENDTLPTTMFSGDVLTYTFMAPFTPGVGVNNLQAWLSQVNDTIYVNDSTSTMVNGVPQITQMPYYEDFENGTGGWVANNATNGTWAFGTPANTNIIGANSGTNAWATGNLTGSYNNNEYSWVQSPCFDLSSLCNPIVEMAINIYSENSWDGAALQASTDGGLTWITIGQFNDPDNWYNDNTINGLNSVTGGDGWTGTSNPGWQIARHSLTAVAGQTSVVFRVVFGSDGSVTYEGFAFDDFKIQEGAELGDLITACGQDSVQLSIFATPTASIVWSTGDTTASIYVNTTGTYSVQYADTSGCQLTDSVIVNMVALPMTVNVGNDTAICDGATLTLTADMPYSNYQWNTGDTTQSITVNQAGGYMVVVTNDCGTAYDNVQVGINPLPTVDLGLDSIVAQGFVLDAGAGFVSYQWSTGATTQVITVLYSGDYSVTVTDANGCSNSDTITLWITGIEELAAQFGAKVYPNPSQGNFTIQLPDSRTKLQAVITDMSGKVVYNETLVNSTIYNVNLTNLSKGMYFLQLSNDEKSVTQKLIIK